jgi:hypothetical protein
MKYSIQISETLFKIVEVEAETEEEALDKVKLEYDRGEIYLTPDDKINETVFEVM